MVPAKVSINIICFGMAFSRRSARVFLAVLIAGWVVAFFSMMIMMTPAKTEPLDAVPKYKTAAQKDFEKRLRRADFWAYVEVKSGVLNIRNGRLPVKLLDELDEEINSYFNLEPDLAGFLVFRESRSQVVVLPVTKVGYIYLAEKRHKLDLWSIIQSLEK